MNEVKKRRIFMVAEEVDSKEASRILNVHKRTFERRCKSGIFKTARKSGGSSNSGWLIQLNELRLHAPLIQIHNKDKLTCPS